MEGLRFGDRDMGAFCMRHKLPRSGRREVRTTTMLQWAAHFIVSRAESRPIRNAELQMPAAFEKLD